WPLGATAQPEEARPRPPGPGHGESDCGEASVALAVPGKALVQDLDALSRPVPLPHQNGSRLEPLAAGLRPDRTAAVAAASRCNAIQHAHCLLVEIAQAFALEPIGQHAKQQVTRQMFRRLAPEQSAPPGAQVQKVEIAQARDLDL